MSAARVFVVELAKTETMTVTIAGEDHDDAMVQAEHVFTGWEAQWAREDDQ